jgi:hypothetical protein
MRKFDGLGVIRHVNQMSVKIWHQLESNLFAIGTLIVCIVNIVSIFVDIFFVFQINLHDGAVVWFDVINPPVFNVWIFLRIRDRLFVIVIHLVTILLIFVNSFNKLVFCGIKDLLERYVFLALKFNVLDGIASSVCEHYEAEVKILFNSLTFLFWQMRLQVFLDLEV